MSRRVKLAEVIGYAILIILLFLVPLFIKGPYYLHILIMAGINIILASSLCTIASTGQASLAHAGFMAIGAYTSAILAMRLGLSFWIALPSGGIAAGLLALLVGYPFVRVRRVYFAMLTLFTGLVIQLVLVEWRDITGGSSGLLNIPPPNPLVIPGLIDINFSSKVPYYYLALILALISLLFLYRVHNTRIGKTFLAIQQSESVAESVGINTAWVKVVALSIGCFFAGIAGSFYAHYVMVLSPTSFTVVLSIYVVVYMIVGGQRRFLGPVLGAFVLTLVPEVFRALKEYQPFVFVGILLVIIFFLREGLVGLPGLIGAQIKKLRGRAIGHT